MLEPNFQQENLISRYPGILFKQVPCLNLRGLTTSSHQIFLHLPGMKNSNPPPSHLGSVWAADPTGRLYKGTITGVFFGGGGDVDWLVVEPTPFEKYESKWVHFPQVGVKIKNI